NNIQVRQVDSPLLDKFCIILLNQINKGLLTGKNHAEMMHIYKEFASTYKDLLVSYPDFRQPLEQTVMNFAVFIPGMIRIIGQAQPKSNPAIKPRSLRAVSLLNRGALFADLAAKTGKGHETTPTPIHVLTRHVI